MCQFWNVLLLFSGVMLSIKSFLIIYKQSRFKWMEIKYFAFAFDFTSEFH